MDKQDRNQWSALMWAMTNKHKGIVKLLLDNGASPDQRTSTGRTALDFIPPDSEMSYYLHDSGYNLGGGFQDDFYSPGFSETRFEEELAESEQRRRMMMESARDLEVDLGNVGIDDQPEVGHRIGRRCMHGTDGVMRSLSMSLKSFKSSTGQDASMTRCLYSKRAISAPSWTSSSRI